MKRKIMVILIAAAMICSSVINSYAADMESTYNFSSAKEYTVNDLMDQAKQRTNELAALGYHLRYDEYDSGNLLKITIVGGEDQEVGPDKLYAVSSSIEIDARSSRKISLYFTVVSLDSNKFTTANKLSLQSSFFNIFETTALSIREPSMFSLFYVNTIDAYLMSEKIYSASRTDRLINIFKSREATMTLTGTYKLKETLSAGFCKDAEVLVALFKELCELYDQYMTE